MSARSRRRWPATSRAARTGAACCAAGRQREIPPGGRAPGKAWPNRDRRRRETRNDRTSARPEPGQASAVPARQKTARRPGAPRFGIQSSSIVRHSRPLIFLPNYRLRSSQRPNRRAGVAGILVGRKIFTSCKSLHRGALGQLSQNSNFVPFHDLGRCGLAVRPTTAGAGRRGQPDKGKTHNGIRFRLGRTSTR